MRHIYIIGNGFDLAHDLKTSYRDFILWYLEKKLKHITEKQGTGINEDDKLIKIIRAGFGTSVTNINPEISCVKDFKEKIDSIENASRFKYNITYSPFLEAILDNLDEDGWSDIEKEYYKQMVNLPIVHTTSPIKVLNESLESLKKELEIYLRDEVLPKIDSKPSLKALEEIFSKEGNNDIKEEQLFLNFNYTNTLKKYWTSPYASNQRINIHGMIDDSENPIIFGYGDEMDRDFKNIENKDDNEYLKNMKSFGYFQTDNYKKVLSFMRMTGVFKVHVIGHSMGLSDRLLLNTIFEHDNCFSIEIHYHKFKEGGDNFYELARNMSRHFNIKMKGKMREIVVPYLESRSMD